MPKKDRKKFAETGFGKFLQRVQDNAGTVLNVGLDIASGDFRGAVETIKGELTAKKDSDEKLAALYYEFLAKEMEFKKEMESFAIQREQEITKRWESDNQGSWMARNVRPIMLFYITLVFSVIIILDSIPRVLIEINAGYLELIESVWITTIGGYFIVRSVDKYGKR